MFKKILLMALLGVVSTFECGIGWCWKSAIKHMNDSSKRFCENLMAGKIKQQTGGV